MQYDPANLELQKKLIGWQNDPESFATEGLPYLKEKSLESFEYLEVLFSQYFFTGMLEEADQLIITAFKNNPVALKTLEFYFGLYDQFSDTPDEALWAVSLLNKIEPSVQKHRKMIELLRLTKKNQLACEEFDKLVETYPDEVSIYEKTAFYLYSEIPEYEEKGFELLKEIDVEKIYPSMEAVNAAGMKFFAGENFDGLIYHFGGEDFRPNNFVSKKEIPNSSTADFNGKSIVITPYRGMGDSMILSRFIPRFIKKWPDCKISIATETPMIPLYKNIPGVAFVGDMNSCAGRLFDCCLGVNMLARYLRDELVDSEGRIPYHEWVAYPEEYDTKWRDAAPKDTAIVGVNWKGSQRLGGGEDTEDGRNLSRDLELSDFKYIIEAHPDKTFVCLNPDIWPEEREWLEKQSNVWIPEKIKNFADTAALIKLCRVVVSTDTSVSTLSASLSKDTIVLAKYMPDYRWGQYKKWWDLSKVNIKVLKKKTFDDGWMHPVCQAIVELSKI